MLVSAKVQLNRDPCYTSPRGAHREKDWPLLRWGFRMNPRGDPTSDQLRVDSSVGKSPGGNGPHRAVCILVHPSTASFTRSPCSPVVARNQQVNIVSTHCWIWPRGAHRFGSQGPSRQPEDSLLCITPGPCRLSWTALMALGVDQRRAIIMGRQVLP